MSKPVEFSEFYRTLNAAKEGDVEKKEYLNSMLKDYNLADNSESHLHHLGQIFISIGMKELYKYAGTEDLLEIGKLQKADWIDLRKKNKVEIHIELANSMIVFAKDNKLSQSIADKWQTSVREINKNLKGMAQYITEGILDSIE